MNKIERNVWKLNNIPPLEYCSIFRAQKLLNCEVEDLLHWHDIGAINLAIKLKNIPGMLNIAISKNIDIANPQSENHLNHTNILRKKEEIWSQYSTVDRVLEIKESVSAIETLHGNQAIQTQIKAIVSGLWHIAEKNLGELRECPDHNQLVQNVSAIAPTKNTLFCYFSADDSSHLSVSLNKIYILSKDVEKIFEHTISSRTLEIAKHPSVILNKEVINEPQFTLQNITLTDFIDEFMQLNPGFNRQSLNANE